MNIHDDLKKNGSFPKGERELCYQEYYYDNKWNKGQREVVNRAKLMDLNPQPLDLVVEIGCQIGGFLQYSYLKGANCIGVDIDKDYIRLAKQLAQENDHFIEYLNSGISQKLLNKLKDHKIDHLLLLSMGKHIGEKKLFEIIDTLKPYHVYLESNAINDKNPLPYYENIKKRGGSIIGNTYDRNKRVLYKISL